MAGFEVITEVVRLLLDSGADLNSTDETGNTPLHSAAFNGRLEIAQLLVDRRADVNRRGFSNKTPLHHAAAAGHVTMVDFLLGHGSDPLALTSEGETALQMATKENRRDVAALIFDRLNSAKALNQASQAVAVTSGFGIYSIRDTQESAVESVEAEPLSSMFIPRGASSGTAETRVSVTGAIAKTRVTGPKPEFIFRLPAVETSEVLGQYFLVKLESTATGRSLKLERVLKDARSTFVPVSPALLPFSIEKVEVGKAGQFKVRSSIDLFPGEYAFYRPGAPFGPGERYTRCTIWAFQVSER